MGLRRIGYALGEPLLLTIDGKALLAYDAVLGTPKWELRFESPLRGVMFASATALPGDAGAGPWRSASMTSQAIAIDARGVLHVIDATAGRIVQTVATGGAVVAMATTSDALAVAIAPGLEAKVGIAFEGERVLLWRGGARHEVACRGSALAFSQDGAELAIGAANGDVTVIEVATRKATKTSSSTGAVNDITARPGGGWILSGERGLGGVHAQRSERILNGTVLTAALDHAGKNLAVHRGEASVVLYRWPPAKPTGRVTVTGGTIHDATFGADGRLGIALGDGDASTIDPATFESTPTMAHPGRKRRLWSLTVESEKARADRAEAQAKRAKMDAPKSTFGAKLGIGTMISVALILVRLVLFASSGSRSPTYTPPSLLGLNGGHSFEQCNRDCEIGRLTSLQSFCARSETVHCAEHANAALVAFESGHCAETRAALDRIDRMVKESDAGGDALVNADRLIAEFGLASACGRSDAGRAIVQPRLELLSLHGPDLEPEVNDLRLEAIEDQQLYAAPDGALFLATRARSSCTMWWKPSGDTWITGRRSTPCRSLALFGRSAREVYLAFDNKLMALEGSAWNDAGTLPRTITSLAGTAATNADVFALDDQHVLYRVHGKTWNAEVQAEDAPRLRRLVGGTSLWADASNDTSNDLLLRKSGQGWTVRTSLGDAGAGSFRGMWVSPTGSLFVAKGMTIARSTNDGVSWREDVLEDAVEHLWGRSNTDVYAAGPSGISHFDGKTWKATSFTRRVEVLAGDAKDIYVLAERE